MTYLISGLIVWTLIHWFPSLASSIKIALVRRIGLWPYKGIFSLFILLGLALIIMGWRGMAAEVIYTTPSWTHHLSMLLMLLAFFCFGATHGKTRLKQYIRHPQLMSVILWSTAHLLSNGDQRSVILFGGLGLWALISTPLISLRDGKWQKPPLPTIRSEMIYVAVSLGLYALTAFILHPYLSGVALY